MKIIAPHLLAVMLAGMAPVASHAQGNLPEDGLIGDWVLPENGQVIHTYRCGDAFCAKIVKVADPTRRDIHNADHVLRRRPILGIVIATSLQEKSPTKWQGKIYNTLNGYTYEGTFNLIEESRFTLVGCLFGSLFCHSKTFYRVERPPPSPPKQQKPPPPRRVVSSDRVEVATPPLPVIKAKPARNGPTHADFEAFLRARDTTSEPALTDQQRQALFNDFLAWLKKQ